MKNQIKDTIQEIRNLKRKANQMIDQYDDKKKEFFKGMARGCSNSIHIIEKQDHYSKGDDYKKKLSEKYPEASEIMDSLLTIPFAEIKDNKEEVVEEISKMSADFFTGYMKKSHENGGLTNKELALFMIYIRFDPMLDASLIPNDWISNSGSS